jgi:DNA-directed RNA polymerase subunit beta
MVKNAAALESIVKQALSAPSRERTALRFGQFEQVPDGEVDYEFGSPNKYFGSHINLIPLQNSVAGPRVFYGARFINQALPVVGAEEPLVQALVDDDPEGRSFDDLAGQYVGAIKAKRPGKVKAIDPDGIDLEGEDGKVERVALYNNAPLNRKTGLTSTPLVKPGDVVAPGHLLAKSNYTNDKGTLAMGLNARIGLVPYLGKSMDDAIVISESFSKRLLSDHLYGTELDYKRGVEGGKAKHSGLFPQKYVNRQLDQLDDQGVVKPGTVVQPGDPLVLAVRPRVVSSASSQLGLLSKSMKNAKTDASQVWDQEVPGVVTDVVRTRSGVRVNVGAKMPTMLGDKIIAGRAGQKAIVSEIVPDDRMPRTVDGQPLEILMNPLGYPSRVNSSGIFELLLGKVAKKTGQVYRLPTFNRPDEKWFDFVQGELDKHGLKGEEEVFDPATNKKLENPVTVGYGTILKLHHQSSSKISARGQGSYDQDSQAAKGSGEGAQAKRLSGLESAGLLSAGAYNFMRDGATVRGTRNDNYWRTLRMGHQPEEPGEPFAYQKFKALLSGTGYLAKKLPGGKERLQLWTDRDLNERKPLTIRNGDIVDLGTLEPTRGGLFDASLTGGNAWGAIDLPHPVIQPAAQDVIQKLLGLTKKQVRAIMAGEMELPEHLRGNHVNENGRRKVDDGVGDGR